MHSSPTDHSYLHQACITPVCKTRDDFDPTANRKELGRRNFARVLSWGRVVERSTTRRRPDVFVAGVYLGCRVILLNAISAPFLTASCMHATAEGENTRLVAAVAQAFLSLETTFATAVNLLWLWLALLHALRFAIVLLHRITVAIVLLHPISRQYDLDRRHVRAQLELQRRLLICTRLNGGTWTTNIKACTLIVCLALL